MPSRVAAGTVATTSPVVAGTARTLGPPWVSTISRHAVAPGGAVASDRGFAFPAGGEALRRRLGRGQRPCPVVFAEPHGAAELGLQEERRQLGIGAQLGQRVDREIPALA